MNDFTKEELECLHNAIALQLRDIPMSETNAIRRTELVGKIQSMIDNYCEHEWKLTFSGSIIKGIYCQKCAIKLKGS